MPFTRSIRRERDIYRLFLPFTRLYFSQKWFQYGIVGIWNYWPRFVHFQVFFKFYEQRYQYIYRFNIFLTRIGFWFPSWSEKRRVKRNSSRLAILWEWTLVAIAFVIVLKFLSQILLEGFFRKFQQLGTVVLTLTFYTVSTTRAVDLAFKRHRLSRLFENIDKILNHSPFRYAIHYLYAILD